MKCHHSEARGVSSASVQYRWRPRAGSLEAISWVISALFQAVVELMATGAVKVAAARLSSWMGVGIS